MHTNASGEISELEENKIMIVIFCLLFIIQQLFKTHNWDTDYTGMLLSRFARGPHSMNPPVWNKKYETWVSCCESWFDL